MAEADEGSERKFALDGRHVSSFKTHLVDSKVLPSLEVLVQRIVVSPSSERRAGDAVESAEARVLDQSVQVDGQPGGAEDDGDLLQRDEAEGVEVFHGEGSVACTVKDEDG